MRALALAAATDRAAAHRHRLGRPVRDYLGGTGAIRGGSGSAVLLLEPPCDPLPADPVLDAPAPGLALLPATPAFDPRAAACGRVLAPCAGRPGDVAVGTDWVNEVTAGRAGLPALPPQPPPSAAAASAAAATTTLRRHGASSMSDGMGVRAIKSTWAPAVGGGDVSAPAVCSAARPRKAGVLGARAR